MRMEADTVDVRSTLPSPSLFVREGAAPFSKVKLDHTEVRRVLGLRRAHSWKNSRITGDGNRSRLNSHSKLFSWRAVALTSESWSPINTWL
jgi:hypothetical protein